MTTNQRVLLNILASRHGTRREVYLTSAQGIEWVSVALRELEADGLAVGNDVGVNSTRAYRITAKGLEVANAEPD